MLILFLAELGTEEEKNRFVALYEARRQEMYAAAFGVLRDAQLAEDAVQDAFLYIAKNFDKIEDPLSRKTSAFVRLVTSSQAKKILRSRKEIPVEALPEEERSFDTEERFFDRYAGDALTRAIEALPERYRTPVLLFYAQDLPTAQVAKIMGVSPDVVRKRLERAREKLRVILTENGEVIS